MWQYAEQAIADIKGSPYLGKHGDNAGALMRMALSTAVLEEAFRCGGRPFEDYGLNDRDGADKGKPTAKAAGRALLRACLCDDGATATFIVDWLQGGLEKSTAPVLSPQQRWLSEQKGADPTKGPAAAGGGGGEEEEGGGIGGPSESFTALALQAAFMSMDELRDVFLLREPLFHALCKMNDRALAAKLAGSIVDLAAICGLVESGAVRACMEQRGVFESDEDGAERHTALAVAVGLGRVALAQLYASPTGGGSLWHGRALDARDSYVPSKVRLMLKPEEEYTEDERAEWEGKRGIAPQGPLQEEGRRRQMADYYAYEGGGEFEQMKAEAAGELEEMKAEAAAEAKAEVDAVKAKHAAALQVRVEEAEARQEREWGEMVAQRVAEEEKE